MKKSEEKNFNIYLFLNLTYLIWHDKIYFLLSFKKEAKNNINIKFLFESPGKLLFIYYY